MPDVVVFDVTALGSPIKSNTSLSFIVRIRELLANAGKTLQPFFRLRSCMAPQKFLGIWTKIFPVIED